jgi:hypothetical protein
MGKPQSILSIFYEGIAIIGNISHLNLGNFTYVLVSLLEGLVLSLDDFHFFVQDPIHLGEFTFNIDPIQD